MIEPLTQNLPSWLHRQTTWIELYSLIVLSEHPGYAYDVAQRINDLYDPGKPATPQGVGRALARMSTIGWIAPYPHMVRSGRNERAYSLTGFGEAQVITELNRLELIIDRAQVSLTQRQTHAMPKVVSQIANPLV